MSGRSEPSRGGSSPHERHRAGPATVAIAAPHALAVRAAHEAAAEGGNAIDAALTAAAVLSVVYPHNCGIGGDLVALVREPDGRIRCVNATGPAPTGADVARARLRHGRALPAHGPDTITVPGAVGGWAALAASGARLSRERHLAAAIRHAEEGVPVSRSLAAGLAEYGTALVAEPGLREIFAPGGRPLPPDGTVRQPALAGTLRALAAEGAGALYGGALGKALAAGLPGRPIDPADLAVFAPETAEPLYGSYRGLRIATSPPNTQGLALVEILALAELTGLPPGDLLRGSADRLVAAADLALRDRDRVLADPRAVPVDVAGLLEPGRLAGLLGAFAGPERGAGPVAARRPGDTVAIMAADSDGRAVSLMQSLYHWFGACVLEPETGILMHNRGSGFSLDPGSPNVLAPGKRPAHTLMPVIASENGAPRWAIGTMGGKAQPLIIAQVLLRLLDGDAGPAALAGPRWVRQALAVQDPPDRVLAEADLPAPAAEAIRRAGWDVVRLNARDETTGHVQLVTLDAAAPPRAAGDPRSDAG